STSAMHRAPSPTRIGVDPVSPLGRRFFLRTRQLERAQALTLTARNMASIPEVHCDRADDDHAGLIIRTVLVVPARNPTKRFASGGQINNAFRAGSRGSPTLDHAGEFL